MHPNLVSWKGIWGRRRLVLALGLGIFSAGFTACKNASEPAPETGRDYYPVAVGNYWVYAVSDTAWSIASGQGAQLVPSVRTVSNYQFRETITETFSDAAGQPAYRMLRAKRMLPTDAWRTNSIFVLTANEQYVALNRNNKRTVELVFPTKEGRSWNFNAFNNSFNDTITAETRQSSRIGQPYNTGGSGGIAPSTYPATLTTDNTGTAAENTLLRRISYQQVFAKAIGPVFRRRVYLAFYNYTASNGLQIFVPNSYAPGFVRRETLIDYGPK